MHRLLSWMVLALLMALASAQAQVSGVISDPAGTAVVGVEVFINRTTIRVQTDELGQFALNGISPGFHELVAYKQGFVLYRAPMRVQEGRNYTLNLKFRDIEKKPKGKGTDESNAAFTQAILGDEGLMLFNEESQPKAEAADGKYRVLSGPVVIEYPNAGYRMTAYFSPIGFQDISDAAYCYQEYQGSNVNQNIAFERTRMTMYKGSLRHLLMALVVGKTSEEGFTLTDHLGQPINGSDRIAPSSSAGYYRLTLNEGITVRYRDQGTTTLKSTGPIDINVQGLLINPKLLLVDGAMNRPGLAHQLPADYLPIANDIESTFAEALKFFYEKIYIQTDKPYYYPGEPLWFKAYVNYYHPSWRDSLSDVMYLDFIGPNKQVLVERMYRIEKGMTHGDLILPDSLPEGTYYLRGYTNLRRNFGDEGLFTKPLPILTITDKIDPSLRQEPSGPQSVSVAARQKTYTVRDKITLDLLLNDTTQTGANLSISVTDAAQVIAIPEPTSILTTYPISSGEIGKIDELKHRIERGVSFYAQFTNNKGIGERTQLSFVQWKTGDILSAETDDDGMFWQTGLQFTDSAAFSYKSNKAKGRPYGKVSIMPRDVPPLLPKDGPELKIVKVGAAQRIFSEYEVPKDNKLLDAIVVTGKKASNDEFEEVKKRTHGRPDYVMTSKNLNVASGNLLYALVGKVPGLIVNPGEGLVYFARAGGTSFVNAPNPMVTVNDVPMAGNAGTILQSIDFNTIESIEFTSRINVLYGEQGAYGVIAVYTKEGLSVDTTDPNFQTIKLPGFSPVRVFLAPTHEGPTTDGAPPDYRSTIYWNPKVEVKPKATTSTVTFFASDLAGLYRVIVEGVTGSGKPVRGEAYLTIEEKP